MAKLITHSLVLSATVFTTFLWTSHPMLTHYTLQLIAFLALTYLLLRKFTNRLYHPTGLLNLEAVIFLTSITLLIVFSTGGATSPLFFTLYFLLFALSLLFEPIQTAILSLLLLPPFLLGTQTPSLPITSATWSNLATLVLITPMAAIFGRKFIELQRQTNPAPKPSQPPQDWIQTSLTPVLDQTVSVLIHTIADRNLPTRLKAPLTHTYHNLKTLLETIKQ